MIGKGQGVGGKRQGLGRFGLAPTKCICPNCGYEMKKTRGVPCRTLKCPKCGNVMIGSR